MATGNPLPVSFPAALFNEPVAASFYMPIVVYPTRKDAAFQGFHIFCRQFPVFEKLPVLPITCGSGKLVYIDWTPPWWSPVCRQVSFPFSSSASMGCKKCWNEVSRKFISNRWLQKRFLLVMLEIHFPTTNAQLFYWKNNCCLFLDEQLPTHENILISLHKLMRLHGWCSNIAGYQRKILNTGIIVFKTV